MSARSKGERSTHTVVKARKGKDGEAEKNKSKFFRKKNGEGANERKIERESVCVCVAPMSFNGQARSEKSIHKKREEKTIGASEEKDKGAREHAKRT